MNILFLKKLHLMDFGECDKLCIVSHYRYALYSFIQNASPKFKLIQFCPKYFLKNCSCRKYFFRLTSLSLGQTKNNIKIL